MVNQSTGPENVVVRSVVGIVGPKIIPISNDVLSKIMRDTVETQRARLSGLIMVMRMLDWKAINNRASLMDHIHQGYLEIVRLFCFLNNSD